MNEGETMQQWRVLCTDASVLLAQIHERREYSPDILAEWERRFRLLCMGAADREAEEARERERVERETFKPCRHCATYDDLLELRRHLAGRQAQGRIWLADFCCGAPLDYVPMSMRLILEGQIP